MNAVRRKEISRALEKLEDAKSILEAVKEEEENAYENLPGGIQDSERGERMQEAIDSLDSMLDSIDEAIDSADEIIG